MSTFRTNRASMFMERWCVVEVPDDLSVMEAATASSDVELLYAQKFAHLVGLAQWVVGDRSLAEELVQETFVRLVENPPRLVDEDALGAYVRTAVMNRCRSRLRRLVLERRHARAAAQIHESEILPDQAVRDAVLALPMRQRQCVALRFYDDLTVDRIAAALDVSAGSVKTHLHRAMRTLDQSLGDRRLT